jgi:hypothetical protein
MPSALRIVDEISELADVTLVALANGDILKYDTGTTSWINFPGGAPILAITTNPITGDYTATSTDRVILCDASSGVMTITLPPVASSEGKDFFIKKIDSSSNNVNIDGNENDEIDGWDIIIVATENQTIHVVCDGSEWRII